MLYEVTLRVQYRNQRADHVKQIVDARSGNQATLMGREKYLESDEFFKSERDVVRVAVVSVQPAPLSEEQVTDEQAQQLDQIVEAAQAAEPQAKKPAPRRRSKATSTK